MRYGLSQLWLLTIFACSQDSRKANYTHQSWLALYVIKKLLLGEGIIIPYKQDVKHFGNYFKQLNIDCRTNKAMNRSERLMCEIDRQNEKMSYAARYMKTC